VPVAERRAKAEKKMQQLRKKGQVICPVQIEGRTIVRSFWGKGWCTHLESFSDFANRLPRGRTYVRNGSVCHLEIGPGQVSAMVSGSKIYNVSILIKELSAAAWGEVKHKCAGSIGSLLELLQGRLSDQVMQVVTDVNKGLFPRPDEISLQCNCPDWAVMCKHVAAVLYGVGHRLDREPELLFTLRGVDPRELISSDLSFLDDTSQLGEDTLSYDQVGDIFGIELDEDVQVQDAQSEGKKAGKPGQAEGFEQQPGKTSDKSKKGRTPLNPPTGKKIARLRKQCAQSVPEFAQRLGVSAASVYRWENTPGKLSLYSRTLEALRQVFAEMNGK
jgi:uncharacterized Zn finger protein